MREAIGMSTRQLGERLGISQQSAAELEEAEMTDSITLKNLKRLAHATGTELVYAFLPPTTFEELLQDQADRRADRVIRRVERSMSLEEQATDPNAQEQRKADLVAEYIRTTPRDLWDQT